MKNISKKLIITKNAIKILFLSCVIIFYLIPITIIVFALSFIPHNFIKYKIKYFCKQLSYHLVFSVLSEWFTHPIYVRVDKRIFQHKKIVTISNHCSNYDWVFLLIFFDKYNLKDSLILLKRSIGKIPFVGYLIQQFGHVYLTRSRNVDVRVLENTALEARKKQQYNIAMYPEGTYIFTESLKKAQEYASKTNVLINNVPFLPRLVLLPRRTGFNTIVNTLDDHYDGVIDMTIMMNPYIFMPSEEFSMSDLFLEQKQVMSQCILVDFVRRDEIGADFLEKLFKKKENKIKNYIEIIEKKTVIQKDDFIKLLEIIDRENNNEALIDMLQITSSYKLLILIIFPAIFFFIYLFIFFINKRIL